MRLSDGWLEGSRDPGLWGGNSIDQRIFRQYLLSFAPAVTLDFWFRGGRVAPPAGNALLTMLSQQHVCSPQELSQISEVLGNVVGKLALDAVSESQSRLLSAEVGPLKGRMVLLVRWENRKRRRQYLSMFIDAEGDGRTIHEIHFSAPNDAFGNYLGLAHDAFRSIQWAGFCPPPMSSIA